MSPPGDEAIFKLVLLGLLPYNIHSRIHTDKIIVIRVYSDRMKSYFSVVPMLFERSPHIGYAQEKTKITSYGIATATVVVSPSSHKALPQCWFNVGPPSATLAQH